MVYRALRLLPQIGLLLASAALPALSADTPVLTAKDDWGSVQKTGTTTIDVLKNDVAGEGSLSITGVGTPSAGTVVISSGKLIYTPAATFADSDSFQYTISDGSATPSSSTATVHIVAPLKAARDRVYPTSETIVVNALSNDSIASGAPVKVTVASAPESGAAKVLAYNRIRYTAGASFHGADELQYVVAYDFGATATAQVVIYRPAVVVQGTFGANIKSSSGQAVGHFTFTATTYGGFTGKVFLGSKVFSLLGLLDAKGGYTGVARSSDGELLPVTLKVTGSGSTASVSAQFGFNEGWTSEQSVRSLTRSTLDTLEGRYTVALTSASSTSTDDGTGTSTTGGGALPQGSGWMTIEVNQDGKAKLKGRTADGRSFSTTAEVMGTDAAAELPFHCSEKHSELSGTLIIGTTVSGDLTWTKEASDDDRYPDAFTTSISAAGGVYFPPEDGERALSGSGNDAGQVTITVSGAGFEEFSRTLRLSEKDKASPIVEGPESISLKIDRRSGTFKGKFRDVDDREQRLKFSGVLLQTDQRGEGLFEAINKTGRVEIGVAASTSDSTTQFSDSGSE